MNVLVVAIVTSPPVVLIK